MTVRAQNASVRALSCMVDDAQAAFDMALLEILLDYNQLDLNRQEHSLALLPFKLQVHTQVQHCSTMQHSDSTSQAAALCIMLCR